MKKEIDLTELRILVEVFYDVQKMRIESSNRIVAGTRYGLSEAKAKALSDWVDERMARQERELKAMVQAAIRDHPLWRQWLKGVKGVGPCIAGGLLAWIRDIGRFATISKLWAYAGLHTIDGVAARRKVGEKANWNDRLKVLAWKASGSFVKVGEGYRRLYEQEKVRLRGLHPEPTPYDPPRFTKARDGEKPREIMKFSDGHIDNMARRKTAKVFLSHVWLRWRELEGLPTESPWIIGKDGHEHLIPVVEK